MVASAVINSYRAKMQVCFKRFWSHRRRSDRLRWTGGNLTHSSRVTPILQDHQKLTKQWWRKPGTAHWRICTAGRPRTTSLARRVSCRCSSNSLGVSRRQCRWREWLSGKMIHRIRIWKDMQSPKPVRVIKWTHLSWTVVWCRCTNPRKSSNRRASCIVWAAWRTRRPKSTIFSGGWHLVALAWRKRPRLTLITI